MQLGGELVKLGESHTCSGSNLRNEGVQSMSIQPPAPPPPHGKNMCQASGTGHWVEMPQPLKTWAYEDWKAGRPTGQRFSSKFALLHIWELPDQPPWCQRGLNPSLSWALTWNCGRMLTSTRRHRASMGRLCQTSEDKAEWNFKRLRKGLESPFRSQQVLLLRKSPYWAPIWALKLLLRWKRKFFNVVKLWWNRFTL